MLYLIIIAVQSQLFPAAICLIPKDGTDGQVEMGRLDCTRIAVRFEKVAIVSYNNIGLRDPRELIWTPSVAPRWSRYLLVAEPLSRKWMSSAKIRGPDRHLKDDVEQRQFERMRWK